MHPTRHDLSQLSVREGRLAPVTCVACGCRLEHRGSDGWRHYRGTPRRDARGCLIPCADDPHYRGITAL